MKKETWRLDLCFGMRNLLYSKNCGVTINMLLHGLLEFSSSETVHLCSLRTWLHSGVTPFDGLV